MAASRSSHISQQTVSGAGAGLQNRQATSFPASPPRFFAHLELLLGLLARQAQLAPARRQVARVSLGLGLGRAWVWDPRPRLRLPVAAAAPGC